MTKAAETRMLILEKAFELIYIKGYQATSIDDIIAKTKVTKGAFYYHFKNKDEMGLAVIKDLMAPFMQSGFTAPLKNENDPVKAIYKQVKNLLLNNEHLIVKYGCPAGNLTQEMSPINNQFGKALARLVKEWQQAIETSIRTGIKNNHVRKGVRPQQVATMVMAGYWGIRNFGKLYGDNACYYVYLEELKHYLYSLR